MYAEILDHLTRDITILLLKTKKKRKFIFDATRFLVSAFKIPCTRVRLDSLSHVLSLSYRSFYTRHVCYDYIIMIKYCCNIVTRYYHCFEDQYVL